MSEKSPLENRPMASDRGRQFTPLDVLRAFEGHFPSPDAPHTFDEWSWTRREPFAVFSGGRGLSATDHQTVRDSENFLGHGLLEIFNSLRDHGSLRGRLQPPQASQLSRVSDPSRVFLPLVRRPPRPRPRLLPHTRLFACFRPNLEPSHRLEQETQAG
jgi:hypothetical protein